MTRLRDNVLSLFGIQAALLVAPLLAIPYLVRVLGPDRFGRVALAQALIGYFVLLTDYGFNLSATRQASAARHDEALLSRLFSAVLFIKLALLAAGFVLLLALVAVVPLFEGDWRLYCAAYLSVLGSVLYPAWFFQGLERMRALAACMLSAQALTLAAVFLLVKEPGDYRLAAGLQAGTSVVAGLMGLGAMKRFQPVRVKWPGRAFVGGVLGDGWHVFTSSLAVSLYTNTTTIVLGALTTPTAVAYFTAADKLVRAVQGCLTPLSQAAYPHIARLRAESADVALAFIRMLLRWQALATLAVSVLVAAFAGPLVDLVFGPAFEAAKPLVRGMALLPFVVGISNVLGVQTMLNFDLKVPFSRILLASGALNLVLMVPLVMMVGAIGAVASLVVTEVCVTVAMAASLNRHGLMVKLMGSRA